MPYTYFTTPAEAAEALRATYAAHGADTAEAFAEYAQAVAEVAACSLDFLGALIALNGKRGEITAADVIDDRDTFAEVVGVAMSVADALAHRLRAIEADDPDDN